MNILNIFNGRKLRAIKTCLIMLLMAAQNLAESGVGALKVLNHYSFSACISGHQIIENLDGD